MPTVQLNIREASNNEHSFYHHSGAGGGLLLRRCRLLLRVQELVTHVRTSQIAGGAGERHTMAPDQAKKGKGDRTGNFLGPEVRGIRGPSIAF